MGKGPSDATQQRQETITNEQINLAKTQDARSQQLFDLTEPGMAKAEKFYTDLASGDNNLIAKAIAPATEKISANTENVVRNLDNSMPRGGTLDLAKEEARISEGAQVGTLQTQAYMSAFPALANLATGGIGLSINEVANAISAFGGASSANQAAGHMEMAGKEQTLGFIGGLAQDAATATSGAMA